MQQLLSSLEDERQRQFRRFVGISAAVHVALAVLFWIGPIRQTRTNLPAVERVELVEAFASAPAARPKPARPAPAKPKPPPPPEKKVLPKEPAPLPKPKAPEAKPKPEPKVEPKPEPKAKEPEPKAKEPEPPPEQELEDVLADLREAAGEPTPEPVEQAAAAPTGRTGGPGILVDPATARWMKEVKIHVTRAWILPAAFRTQPLIAIVEVDLSPTGEVLGTRMLQGSGNPWYDESVERAIEKASPVPAPPEAGDWPFTFDSRDML